MFPRTWRDTTPRTTTPIDTRPRVGAGPSRRAPVRVHRRPVGPVRPPEAGHGGPARGPPAAVPQLPDRRSTPSRSPGCRRDATRGARRGLRVRHPGLRPGAGRHGPPLGVDPFAPQDRDLRRRAPICAPDLSELDGYLRPGDVPPQPRTRSRPGRQPRSGRAHAVAPRPHPACGCRRSPARPTATYGADWVQLDAPRHLTVFSREGVDALAQRHGLRVTAARDDSMAFQFWGSEQVRRRIPLMAPELPSDLASGTRCSARPSCRPGRSGPSALNAAAQGDQVAWVLMKDPAAGPAV